MRASGRGGAHGHGDVPLHRHRGVDEVVGRRARLDADRSRVPRLGHAWCHRSAPRGGVLDRWRRVRGGVRPRSRRRRGSHGCPGTAGIWSLAHGCADPRPHGPAHRRGGRARWRLLRYAGQPSGPADGPRPRGTGALFGGHRWAPRGRRHAGFAGRSKSKSLSRTIHIPSSASPFGLLIRLGYRSPCRCRAPTIPC